MPLVVMKTCDQNEASFNVTFKMLKLMNHGTENKSTNL